MTHAGGEQAATYRQLATVCLVITWTVCLELAGAQGTDTFCFWRNIQGGGCGAIVSDITDYTEGQVGIDLYRTCLGLQDPESLENGNGGPCTDTEHEQCSTFTFTDDDAPICLPNTHTFQSLQEVLDVWYDWQSCDTELCPARGETLIDRQTGCGCGTAAGLMMARRKICSSRESEHECDGTIISGLALWTQSDPETFIPLSDGQVINGGPIGTFNIRAVFASGFDDTLVESVSFYSDVGIDHTENIAPYDVYGTDFDYLVTVTGEFTLTVLVTLTDGTTEEFQESYEVIYAITN